MGTFINNLGREIMSTFKVYTNASMWGKILILTLVFILVIMMFKSFRYNRVYEGFKQQDEFITKVGGEVYDDFYAEIYDYLVYNNMKDEYEVGEIVNKTAPTSESVILDIGSGTGHHVASLKGKGFEAIGIDISPSMVQKAKENYPDNKYKQGDALDVTQFEPNTFTHIICMYFTIYYFKDKQLFFQNCMKWLMPGGTLVIHMVDRDKFDPILPPGNPLMSVSPQRYAKERITSTKVKFNDFNYSADFKLNDKTNIAKFEEKFKNDNDGKVRKNEHIMYMEPLESIVQLAQQSGFILKSQVDLVHCQYEYQYLYIFTKPN
mgnify:CR=1 FL=1